jgi:hypothetical protein
VQLFAVLLVAVSIYADYIAMSIVIDMGMPGGGGVGAPCLLQWARSLLVCLRQ